MTVRSLWEKDTGNGSASMSQPRNIFILFWEQYLFKDTEGSVYLTFHNFVERMNSQYT